MTISSLSFKISAPIVLISALAIGLTVFLNVGKLERTLDEVEQSRLHFTLADLQDNLETGLDLGLPIRGLGNAQAAIDFETRADPDILSISVVDTKGTVVFHGGSAAATPTPPLVSIKGASWNRRETDALVSGIKLSNNFGVTAGAVVIRYSPRSHDRFVEAISSQLGAAALAAMLLSSACFLFGIQVLGRRVTGSLRSMEDTLQGHPLDPRGDAAAQALVGRVRQTTDAARTELDAARQALQPAGGGGMGEAPEQFALTPAAPMAPASPVSVEPVSVQQTAQIHARPVRRLFVFVLAVLMVSQLAVSLLAWSLAERQFVPELERKAQAVGVSLSNKLTRALGYGIPVEQLVGVDEFFAEVLRENADLAFLSLTDDRGQVLFRSGKALPAGGGGDAAGAAGALEVATDVSFESRRVGQLHVGVDQQYVASRIAGLRYDIAIVLVTSLLIAFEILWLVVTLNLSAPIRQAVELMTRMADGDFRQGAAAGPGRSLAAALNRLVDEINQGHAALLRLATEPARRAIASPRIEGLRQRYRFAEDGLSQPDGEQRLIGVRILTVLFMSAEMLSRSFLPIYAGSLSDHGLDLSDSLRSSLPITAFLLSIAIAMPYAGRWSDQIGRRRSYITGAFFIATGLAISGLIPDYLMLIVARAVTGLGYAMMFMACQGMVIDHTSLRDRGKGFARVISAIAIAQICAPPIGGILADRVGYALVFIAGMGVALVAAAVASRLLDNQVSHAQEEPPAARLRLSMLYGNHRFWTLALLSGVPAQLIYTGFLSYLVPTLLSGMGSTQSEIGRATMVYGLIMVALVPLFAWCCKRFETYALAVGLGGLLTGLGLLSLHWDPSPGAVVIGIAALALGHSMSISAQLVLVTRAVRDVAQQVGSGPVLGVFRLMERLGAAAGPVAAGLLVGTLGAPRATVWLGGFGLAATALFTLAFFLTGRLSPRLRAA